MRAEGAIERGQAVLNAYDSGANGLSDLLYDLSAWAKDHDYDFVFVARNAAFLYDHDTDKNRG